MYFSYKTKLPIAQASRIAFTYSTLSGNGIYGVLGMGFFYLFIDSHEGDTFSFVLIDFSFPSSLSTDMTKVEECKGTLLVR